jgi:hypothetical protein
MAKYLGGSDVGFEIPGLGVFPGGNITPDKETGIGNLNNGSNGDYEGQIGGDIPIGNFGRGKGVLSLDAIYKWEKDAVNLSLSGVSNVAGVPVAPYLPQTLTATISNNQNVMLLSKYTVGSLKL